MIQVGDLSVDRVKSNDADGMHQLMTTNAERV